uniref:Major latex-like protein 1 n=1 Tax=Plantago major TaxID=29818 RepID=Q5ZF57_PLAMJ|nr:major latex-like protein 1 [Plantago major]
MAQIAKVEALVQTKCCSTKVYDLMKNNLAKLVDILPAQFKSVELLGGEEGCAGHVKLVKYDLGGPKTVKLRFEVIDDAKKSMEIVAFEGDVMQLYKSFKTTITAVDGNTVKWSIEFEKANELAPAPDHYILLATQVTKMLDAYLVI